MAFTKDTKILASDYTALKDRINEELERRNGYGDVSGYSAPYTNVPVANGKVLSSHANEIIEPMQKINTKAVVNATTVEINSVQSLNTVKTLDKLDAIITVWNGDKMEYKGNNSCSALCSGMCTTECSGSCSGGCKGSCGTCGTCGTCGGCGSCGGCGNTCTGGCDTTSTGACSGCTGSCTGHCGNCGGCGTRCEGSCVTSGSVCSVCDGTCIVSAS